MAEPQAAASFVMRSLIGFRIWLISELTLLVFTSPLVPFIEGQSLGVPFPDVFDPDQRLTRPPETLKLSFPLPATWLLRKGISQHRITTMPNLPRFEIFAEGWR